MSDVHVSIENGYRFVPSSHDVSTKFPSFRLRTDLGPVLRHRARVCLSIFFESAILRSDVISARFHAVIRLELKTLLYFIYRTQRVGM